MPPQARPSLYRKFNNKKQTKKVYFYKVIFYFCLGYWNLKNKFYNSRIDVLEWRLNLNIKDWCTSVNSSNNLTIKPCFEKQTKKESGIIFILL